MAMNQQELPVIFDGYQAAAQLEAALVHEVTVLKQQGKQLTIAAVLFSEDIGSQLYTRLKSEAAARVGINYLVHAFSLLEKPEVIAQTLQQLNNDSSVTGIIIQKPWTKTWLQTAQTAGHSVTAADFLAWWSLLVNNIAEAKDVDGLHPHTLELIKQGSWEQQNRVLPATCEAVLHIVRTALNHPSVLTALSLPVAGSFSDQLKALRTVVIGRSDLLGKPLTYVLANYKCDVTNIGRKEFNELVEQKKFLREFDVVVTATGIKDLVTGEMLKENAIVIDAGEPRPDLDYASVLPKVSFVTPVPGGVGPLTVMSLLRNCVRLVVAQ